MLKMDDFGFQLSEYGYSFFSGVPCSFLKPMINYAINKDQFVMAANEGDAVAICAGATLGGKKSVFLCQNSGLTNAVSPLTSLNFTFEIPVLGFVSLRGEFGIPDEPQHELMGVITSELLTVMKIKHAVLSKDSQEAYQQLQQANNYIEAGESFFFIVQKDTFDKQKLLDRDLRENKEVGNIYTSQEVLQPQFSRLDVLTEIQRTTASNNDILILATTGVTGRELFEIGDKANQFYMVGSMGCVSSIGLGLALAQPNKKVLVIDGDGALLMRMGVLATNAYYKPKNLYHILLDNNVHESTGGQKTVASNVDFLTIASASGYPAVKCLSNLDDIRISIEEWMSQPRLTFSYMKIKTGVKEGLGRPTVSPLQVKERFVEYCEMDEVL